jgi:alpha-N-arabinofuranosidase
MLMASLLLSLAAAEAPPSPAPDPPAAFDWFEYVGRDPAAESPLPAGAYRNPVLPGFHPDPSVVRVGSDYYLVTSSFAYFPGVPIFHSRDLVSWRPIGHVLARPSQLDLDGLQVSEGIFAPTLRFHHGTFYMITTRVGGEGGGNFYVTATDPAGPWSDPVWLREIDGIDPSLFFDDDDRAYVVHNGPPPGGRAKHDGHRAIYLREVDLAAGRVVGESTLLVDGGVDLAAKPVWIEAPHVLKKDGWYVLVCAEGGTGDQHSEVVFRSRSLRGPYVPWDRNPILTQRTLDPARPDPVTSTGHADLVETPEGAWWAVFLGCRPYAAGFYNTGRETFLLPVEWTDGWPAVLAPGLPVPSTAPAPLRATKDAPAGGNFSWRDDFDRTGLDPAWNFLRTPREPWLAVGAAGTATLAFRPVGLWERGNPSFLARRQQHAHFTASTELQVPVSAGRAAGLAAFQDETHHFFLGVRRAAGAVFVFLERVATKDKGARPEVVSIRRIAGASRLDLKVEGDGGRYAFFFATAPGAWIRIGGEQDGTVLSTAAAGGFVGAYVGLHARLEP